MNFASQVTHIMVKDVRRHRWMLLAYGVLLLIGTLQALGIITDTLGYIGTVRFLLTLVAVTTAAMFVQEDSPIRADAFWLTRPIAPRAMFVAKFCELVVVLVVAVALLQLLLLYRLNLTMPGFMLQLVAADGFFLMMLLVAAAIAANTRDLKSAVMAGVLLLIVSLFVSAAFANNVLPDMSHVTRALWSIVGGLGAAGSIYWLYTARDRRVAPALLALASTYLVLFMSNVRPLNDDGVQLSSAPVPVAIDTSPSNGFNPWNVTSLRYHRTSDGPERLIVRNMSVTHVRGTGERRAGYERQLWQPVGEFDPRLIRDMQWLNRTEGGTTNTTDYSDVMVMGTGNPDAPISGDTLFYSGRVDLMKPRIIAERSVSDTIPAVIDNARMTIVSPATANASAMLELKIQRLSDWFGQRSAFEYGAPTYALFNNARNEALILRPYTTKHAGNELLIPTLAVSEVTYRFTVDSSTFAKLESPTQWVRDSKLAIVVWDRVTSFPITHRQVVR